MRRYAVLLLLLVIAVVALPNILRAPTRAQDATPAAGTPAAGDSEVIARRYFEQLLNQADDAAIDELLAPEFVLYVNGAAIPGADGFRAFLAGLHEAFPDVHYTVVDIFSSGSGDQVAARWVVSGTHQGVFNGIPATGKSISRVPGISTFRINADGQITGVWVVVDTLGLLQQLGVVPMGGEPGSGTPEAAGTPAA